MYSTPPQNTENYRSRHRKACQDEYPTYPEYATSARQPEVSHHQHQHPDYHTQSCPMERSAPSRPLEESGYGYTLTQHNRYTGVFSDQVPQAYGPGECTPRTIPIPEERSSREQAEFWLREVAGTNMNERQIDRECKTRGISHPIKRYTEEDDDIGNLRFLACGPRGPPHTNHQQIIDSIERLGLTDTPSKPAERRYERTRKPSQSSMYAEAWGLAPYHHRNSSVSLDEIKYLPSCG